MNILIDHCLDWRLVRCLPGHNARHTGKLGWGALKNGALLKRAEAENFEIFVTSDKNLPFQQNISRLKLAVVVLDVLSNKLEDCIPKMSLLIDYLPEALPGTVVFI